MILIVTDHGDNSTDDVMEWVQAFGERVVRVNMEDNVKIKLVKYVGNFPVITFVLNDEVVVGSNEITSYWYRRGDVNLSGTHRYPTKIRNKKLNEIVSNNLKDEVITIRDLLYYVLKNKSVNLGNYFLADNNKLIHNTIAKEAGLSIPESIICSDKDELIRFYNKFPAGIITKSISNGIAFVSGTNKKNTSFYAQYTNLLTNNDIDKISNIFFPTLLQERINKKFELRIFYLKSDFYAMAIFSQNDKQTEVDFRRYNHKKPNRRVPYTLPPDIKRKLLKFMKAVGLDTGSIDMMYATNDQYYFLEVNPVGQFGMVSYSCNYGLEKKIAIQLLKK